MKGNLSFDLSLTEDGKVYDIVFKRDDIIKKNIDHHDLGDNSLIEHCNEKEETTFTNDNLEEEDTCIVKIYEGNKYVTFPGISSVYTEYNLTYVGAVVDGSIKFTPIGESIHRPPYKNKI